MDYLGNVLSVAISEVMQHDNPVYWELMALDSSDPMRLNQWNDVSMLTSTMLSLPTTGVGTFGIHTAKPGYVQKAEIKKGWKHRKAKIT